MENIYTHPTALVETDQIGEGTRVWAYAHILKGAAVGAFCNIGDHCFIESGAVVGSYVTIKNGNMIWEGVTLADGVFVGPHVFFTNDLYPRSPRYPLARGRYEDKSWLVPTHVQEGASLGAAAVIRAGVTIGAFALVGAGAVVTRDVPPHALVVGNPAQIVGWVAMDGQPLRFEGETALDAQGNRYTLRSGRVTREVNIA
ncbi:MAG: N-acetyltransferase [Chloroflexaceae bacterium]|nr:N-acetyltransferase [Chloroflexaceae bacterium]NJO06825.1 N-acetyltransferase [Chloroflexaceae bacterium]NJO84166.1 N-acetyltransferase [Blastochloris sp.]